MTQLNASATGDKVVHRGSHMNPDDHMASLRDNRDRRSTGKREVNGAWLGHIGEEAHPRKLPSQGWPASAGMTRAFRLAVPWVGAGNFWIGILIGAVMAGLVVAII